MKAPLYLRYAATDEWVRLEGNIATIGVTDYAQEQLSDVVFVEIVVSIGDHVEKGKTIATIESVKAAADVNAPVSGKVIAVNEALSQTPEEINNDPFDKAWMIKMEISSQDEFSSLMDANAYIKHCEERSH